MVRPSRDLPVEPCTEPAACPVIELDVAAFKDTCLQILSEVQAGVMTVVVTRNGLPIARVIPALEEMRSTFGFMMRRALEVEPDRGIHVDFEVLVAVDGAEKPEVALVSDRAVGWSGPARHPCATDITPSLSRCPASGAP